LGIVVAAALISAETLVVRPLVEALLRAARGSEGMGSAIEN
jgi:hypothetical protein